MESLILAVTVVWPLVAYMTVGVFIGRWGLMSKESFRMVNDAIFRIFLPLTLFFDVYDTDISTVLRPSIVAFVAAGAVLLWAFAWVIVSKFVEEDTCATVMIQGIYRSNYVLFGVSIARSVCGEDGVALAAALAALVVPLFNVLSVILFEVRRGSQVKVFRVFIGILKNPLVVAGVSGGICAAVGIRLPELACSPLRSLGDIATPLALVSLGGLLSVGSILRHRVYLMATVVVRLVVVPLVMLSTAVAFGMRGDVLIILLAVFGSPTAVASAPMAQAMGGNGELAGEIVAATSVACVVTVFFFVFGKLIENGTLIEKIRWLVYAAPALQILLCEHPRSPRSHVSSVSYPCIFPPLYASTTSI